MREVGVLEAKTHLSALLDEVERAGEELAITRRGKIIAKIIPAAPAKMSRADVVARFARLRDHIADTYGEATDFDIKAAIEEGRE